MDITQTDLYKYAAQKKLRFNTAKGNLTVEDLFQLSQTDLDTLYKALSSEKKNTSEDSLLSTANPADELLAVKLALVRDVFNTKKADRAAKETEAQKRADIQRIKELIAAKENEALASKSADELKDLLKAMENSTT